MEYMLARQGSNVSASAMAISDSSLKTILYVLAKVLKACLVHLGANAIRKNGGCSSTHCVWHFYDESVVKTAANQCLRVLSLEAMLLHNMLALPIKMKVIHDDWCRVVLLSSIQCNSGSQPFETRGTLAKCCISSRTTIKNCSTSALWLIYYIGLIMLPYINAYKIIAHRHIICFLLLSGCFLVTKMKKKKLSKFFYLHISIL